MPIEKITKSFVDKVPFTKKGQVGYCDPDLPGFYLVVGMQSKTYYAQRDMNGRTVRCKIGRHGRFTTEEARKEAKDKLYMMSKGINPNTLKDAQRAKDITLQKVFENYITVRKSLNERTKQDYEYYLNKYVPDWLDRMMPDISRDMIVARHAQIGEENGPRVANGTMRILRALFNHAHVKFDICPVNPVSYLSKIKAWYPEKRRQSYVKPHQLKKWWQAVHELQSDTMRDYLLLILFSGLRRNEAATLKFSDLDFNDKTFRIENTKNGDALVLPMSNFLFEMFERRRKRHGNAQNNRSRC